MSLVTHTLPLSEAPIHMPVSEEEEEESHARSASCYEKHASVYKGGGAKTRPLTLSEALTVMIDGDIYVYILYWNSYAV